MHGRGQALPSIGAMPTCPRPTSRGGSGEAHSRRLRVGQHSGADQGFGLRIEQPPMLDLSRNFPPGFARSFLRTATATVRAIYTSQAVLAPIGDRTVPPS